MKPLTRSLRIRKPLTAPIAAPTGQAERDRRPGGQQLRARRSARRRRAAPATGRSPGARPMVDSSDRSIRPLIRISASPSTSRPSSVDCWTTPIRLSWVRNAGETMKPMTPSTKITGTRDRSRQRAEVDPGPAARRAVHRVGGRRRCGLGHGAVPVRAFRAFRAPCVRSGAVPGRTGRAGRAVLAGPAMPSIAATSSWSLQPRPNSAIDPPVEERQHPVADPQVVQLVGDDQAPLPAVRDLPYDAEQRVLGLHVHARGGPDHHQHARVAGQRAGDDDLLLVAAGQAGDRLRRARWS